MKVIKMIKIVMFIQLSINHMKYANTNLKQKTIFCNLAVIPYNLRMHLFYNKLLYKKL